MRALTLSVMVGVFAAAPALAGPVVRQASGADAAAIQAAVDQFRTDLGANNGPGGGPSSSGRREINWDGGGAAAPDVDPIPMTRFAARGARSSRPALAWRSAAPRSPIRRTERHVSRPVRGFSSPRIFSRAQQQRDGRAVPPGGQHGDPGRRLGFRRRLHRRRQRDLDLAAVLHPRRRAALRAGGASGQRDATLSFLGVWFNAGEVVGRVRIVSGNVAFGPRDRHARRGGDGRLHLFRAGDHGRDDTLPGVDHAIPYRTVRRGDRLAPWTSPIVSGQFLYDGADVTGFFLSCIQAGTQTTGGGFTFRCPLPGSLLSPGEHVLQVEAGFADGSDAAMPSGGRYRQHRTLATKPGAGRDLGRRRPDDAAESKTGSRHLRSYGLLMSWSGGRARVPPGISMSGGSVMIVKFQRVALVASVIILASAPWAAAQVAQPAAATHKHYETAGRPTSRAPTASSRRGSRTSARTPSR